MFGVPMRERAARTTEIVEVLQQAWTGEPFEHRGRTVRVTPGAFTARRARRSSSAAAATARPGGRPGWASATAVDRRQLGRLPRRVRGAGPARPGRLPRRRLHGRRSSARTPTRAWDADRPLRPARGQRLRRLGRGRRHHHRLLRARPTPTSSAPAASTACSRPTSCVADARGTGPFALRRAPPDARRHPAGRWLGEPPPPRARGPPHLSSPRPRRRRPASASARRALDGFGWVGGTIRHGTSRRPSPSRRSCTTTPSPTARRPTTVQESLIARPPRSWAASAGMQIAPEQGTFMTLLTSWSGPGSRCEVGTFTATRRCASPAAWRRAAGCCAATSARSGRRSPGSTGPTAGVDDRIELRIAPGRRHAARPSRRPADRPRVHRRRQDRLPHVLRRDRRAPAPRRARAASTTCCGAARWSTPPTRATTPQPFERVNDHVAADPRVEVVMLPIADGLTIARKR